ncbi:hypothetical protein TNCV_162651 [Trichonephila clavipes]|nr:hypothetical protein TNCV_162651 [Trichonephila clavipes]
MFEVPRSCGECESCRGRCLVRSHSSEQPSRMLIFRPVQAHYISASVILAWLHMAHTTMDIHRAVWSALTRLHSRMAVACSKIIFVNLVRLSPSSRRLWLPSQRSFPHYWSVLSSTRQW